MTSLLVTAIFLLSSGAPASKAYVSCSGVITFIAGDDRSTVGDEGARLLLDKRGALVLNVPKPVVIRCWARQDGESWRGNIDLSHHGKVQRITLRGDS